MKRRTRIIAAILCAIAVLAVVEVVSVPIYGKLLTGTARILTERIPITVKIGDRRIERVWCFRESNRFRGGVRRSLILWLESPRAMFGRHVLILDLDHGTVHVPNSAISDYRLILRRWLVQSEKGDGGVPFGAPKLDTNDPDFQQSGNEISFTIPPVLNLPPGRWELTIDGKNNI